MSIKTLKLPFGQIKGLMQGIDKSMLSFSYSPDCQNIDVDEGIISTRKGSVPLFPSNIDATYPITAGTIKTVLMFQGNGIDRVVIGTLSGSTVRWYSQKNDGWSLITTDGSTPATALRPGAVRSVMYMLSGEAIMILVSAGQVTQKITYGEDDTMRMVALSGAPKGNDIALHRERVWISKTDDAGNATSKVAYCNAYLPEDWTTSGETGEVIINTNDNDQIIGIRKLLGNILIFKKYSITRITGYTPADYDVDDIYAVNGALSADAICSDGSNCFFASSDGIYRYNGTTAEPFLRSEIETIFGGMDNIKCTICNNKLYVWDRKTSGNNKHIVYDTEQKKLTVLYIYGVKDAEVFGDIVAFTTGWYVTKLSDTAIKYNAGLTDSAAGSPPDDLSTIISCYWISPESTLGYPNAEKTLTDLYFTGWGTTSAGAAGGQVKITAYYNRNGTTKTKEKTITLQTTRKPHRIGFNLTGRIFKFKFENVSGSAINIADIEPVFELSED